MSIKLIFHCSSLFAGRGRERQDFIQVSREPTFGNDCRVLLSISNPYELRENIYTWVDSKKGDWKKVFRFDLEIFQTIIYEFPVALAPDNALSEILKEVNDWRFNFESCGVKFDYFFWNLDLSDFGYEVEMSSIEKFVGCSQALGGLDGTKF